MFGTAEVMRRRLEKKRRTKVTPPSIEPFLDRQNPSFILSDELKERWVQDESPWGTFIYPKTFFGHPFPKSRLAEELANSEKQNTARDQEGDSDIEDEVFEEEDTLIQTSEQETTQLTSGLGVDNMGEEIPESWSRDDVLAGYSSIKQEYLIEFQEENKELAIRGRFSGQVGDQLHKLQTSEESGFISITSFDDCVTKQINEAMGIITEENRIIIVPFGNATVEVVGGRGQGFTFSSKSILILRGGLLIKPKNPDQPEPTNGQLIVRVLSGRLRVMVASKLKTVIVRQPESDFVVTTQSEAMRSKGPPNERIRRLLRIIKDDKRAKSE